MTLWRDRLDMSTLDRVLPSLVGVKREENKAIISRLIASYSDIFSDYMDRAPRYRERTRYFDVCKTYPTIKLRAWPIGIDPASGTPLVEIANDVSSNPTYTTPLTYPSDYRVYTDEEGQGRVEFLTGLLPGRQALQITWTGGMATKTEIAASDGVLTNPGSGADGTLTSASSAFVDDLVQVGMSVLVGSNTRTIKSVVDNHNIVIDGEWAPSDVGAGVSFSIPEGGFVGEYPKIEQALITQIVYHWKRKDKLDIRRMGVRGGAGGMDVEFLELNPLDLLDEVKRTLDAHALREYV